MKHYDVIIVGAGPTGIFAALELTQGRSGLKVLMIEKGSDLPQRKPMDFFYGWGGAGTFSDGKLNLSPDVGGFLKEFISRTELEELITYVDEIYLRFGAPSETQGSLGPEVDRISAAAKAVDLTLVPFRIRHLGTDRCRRLLSNLREELSGKVDIEFNKEVGEIIYAGSKVRGIKVLGGDEYRADYVLLSPGRSGAQWLESVALKVGLTTTLNPIDIGVRVEVPANILRPLTDVLYEAKLTFKSKRFGDPVRTFCMNPYGYVVKENHEEFCTVNGHSFSSRKSENTNFAILASTTFTEPFREPIAYGRLISRLANLLGDGIIVQRLGDLMAGRRSTWKRIRGGLVSPTLTDATPGDLSFAIPYRYIVDILEMLEALNVLAPGINAPSTLLYGVEVKFYSMRLDLTKQLETEIKNLFAAGDGAGVTRGIVQASVSGVMAAREIGKRLDGPIDGHGGA